MSIDGSVYCNSFFTCDSIGQKDWWWLTVYFNSFSKNKNKNAQALSEQMDINLAFAIQFYQ